MGSSAAKQGGGEERGVSGAAGGLGREGSGGRGIGAGPWEGGLGFQREREQDGASSQTFLRALK